MNTSRTATVPLMLAVLLAAVPALAQRAEAVDDAQTAVDGAPVADAQPEATAEPGVDPATDAGVEAGADAAADVGAGDEASAETDVQAAEQSEENDLFKDDDALLLPRNVFKPSEKIEADSEVSLPSDI